MRLRVRVRHVRTPLWDTCSRYWKKDWLLNAASRDARQHNSPALNDHQQFIMMPSTRGRTAQASWEVWPTVQWRHLSTPTMQRLNFKMRRESCSNGKILKTRKRFVASRWSTWFQRTSDVFLDKSRPPTTSLTGLFDAVVKVARSSRKYTVGGVERGWRIRHFLSTKAHFLTWIIPYFH